MFDICLMMASATSQLSSLFIPSPLKLKPPIERTIVIQNSQKIPFKLSVRLLEAYEDRTPPPGTVANHPVGHAVVRLRIENLAEKSISLDIGSIKIHQAENNKILMFQPVKSLNLGGLQILEQGFHITNRQGFNGSKKVKAVVNYQVNGKKYSVASPVSEVFVNP
jgi:hypothetical protein